MVKIEDSLNDKHGMLDNGKVIIIADALLHELERYNRAYDLVCDEDAKRAINEAKAKVYEVFCIMNSFTKDE